MTLRTYIERAGIIQRRAETLRASGAVKHTAGLVLLSHPSTPIAATLPAPLPGDDLIIVNTSTSGTAAHTVTCSAGVSLDAAGNTTATLNAPGEALHLVGLSRTRWLILENIGAVGLSGAPPPSLADALLASSPLSAWLFAEEPGAGSASALAGAVTLTLPGGQDFAGVSGLPPFGGRIGGGSGPTASVPSFNRNTGSAVAAFYIGGNVFGVNSSWFSLTASGFDLTSYFEAPTSVTLFHPDGGTATATGVPSSGWVFLAATWDDATNTISIRVNDGTPVTGSSTTTYAPGGTFVAGSGFTGGGDALGPMALYDRALTSIEIDELYAAFAAEVGA